VTGGHPTLLAAAGVRIVRRRRLPAAGDVLVAVGERVAPDRIVARARPPGAMVPVNVAYELDIAPSEVPDAVVVPLGAEVARGAPLARTAGLWGLLRSYCYAPVTGVVRDVSASSGQVVIEATVPAVELTALIAGTVIGVEPGRGVDVCGRATLVQGVLGVGGEVSGRLVAAVARPEDLLSAELIGPELGGCVVLGGASITGAALHRAREIGVAAVITGGIDDTDLTDHLGRELNVAVTGQEDVRPAVVVTGGFGRVGQDPHAFDLLRRRAGELASVRAATRIRAGAERPEVIVSESDPTDGPADSALASGIDGDIRAGGDGGLSLGRRVRIVAAPFRGRIGQVVELSQRPHAFAEVGTLPAVVVALPGEQRAIVPRANVELLAGSSGGAGSADEADEADASGAQDVPPSARRPREEV
jgi:hypothetical protein